MSELDHFSSQFEPENESRDVTIRGNVEDSAVVVSGNNNVIYVNGMPVALPVADQEAQKPLRILTIVARPLNANELPDIADAWSLADGLLAVEAPVEIRFLRPPTVEQLQADIDAGWDILHFDGHGTAEEGGFLLFEEENGLGKLLPTERFIEMLKRAGQPPRLLILSACQSAKPFKETQGTSDDRGLASRVAKEAKVPAVIGFSETVPVYVTMALVKRLYAALGAGRTVLDSFEAAKSALGDAIISLPPEKENETERKVRAAELPILLGEGIQQKLCEAKRGKAIIERERFVGVPSPSESGRFYGIFDDNTKPPTGRKVLLARAAQALLESQKFIVLTGVGGIGKTALAAALARRMAWRFPGGVFWVNGADYIETGMTLDDTLAPFAAVFGQDFLKLPVGGKRQAVMAYFEQMESPALWIIDNADVASDAVWRMAREVPGRSACLLTSRERPEYGGSIISVEGMAPEEGLIFLLEETVRRKGRGFTLDEEATQAFVRIAGLLDGHALALMHAAALIADEGLGNAERIVKANPARGHVSRRFDFSYARLEEDERRLLHCLSAFAADFDGNAIAAVCTIPLDEQDKDLISDWDEPSRGLTRKSFVEVEEWNEKYRRYRLHPVMREYVHGKAKDTLALDEWRMARYFLAMAEAAHDLLGDTQRALAAVAFAGRERLNLLAGQEICLAQKRHKEVIQYTVCLDNLFDRSGYWYARKRELENGLKAAQRQNDQSMAARVLGQLGNLAYQQGNYEDARSAYQEIITIFENAGDKSSVAITLHQLGMLAKTTGDYPEARRLYEQSLEIEQQLGNQAGVAYTLGNLANLAYSQGEYSEAKENYLKVLSVSEELRDQSSVAKALHQLGVLAQDTGDYAEARRLYAQSLEIEQQLGDKSGMAQTLGQLGNLAYQEQNYQEARSRFLEIIDIFKQLGDKASVAQTLHQLGVLSQRTSDYAEARRLYAQSLEIEQQLGDKSGMAHTLHQLGVLAQQTGNYSGARNLYTQSLEIAQLLGDKAGVAQTLHQLGRLAEEDGKLEEALALVKQAEEILTSLGAPNSLIAKQSRQRIEEKLNKQ